MTNEERRKALNLARNRALYYAELSELSPALNYYDIPSHELATMWAHVAQAMKDGSPDHDGPDGLPTNQEIITR